MKNVPAETLRHNIKYLDLLSRSFPNVTTAVEEVVNLKAILNLPKGTEHFLTDIHGEAEAFNHVMQNYKLVRINYLPAGTGGAGNSVKVYAVKGTETAAEELCLHNGRAAAGG